eukprot:240325-Lingulodinium_polyedra.AAC.1
MRGPVALQEHRFSPAALGDLARMSSPPLRPAFPRSDLPQVAQRVTYVSSSGNTAVGSPWGSLRR